MKIYLVTCTRAYDVDAHYAFSSRAAAYAAVTTYLLADVDRWDPWQRDKYAATLREFLDKGDVLKAIDLHNGVVHAYADAPRVWLRVLVLDAKITT